MPRRSCARKKNASARSRMDDLPPTPSTPSSRTSHGSLFSDPSDDEWTIARKTEMRKTRNMRVCTHFVRALSGASLFKATVEMTQAYTIGCLFGLVKIYKPKEGNCFSLKVRKQVWNKPADLCRKVLVNPAVQDALEVNEDGNMELRIGVIFMERQATSIGSSVTAVKRRRYNINTCQ